MKFDRLLFIYIFFFLTFQLLGAKALTSAELINKEKEYQSIIDNLSQRTPWDQSCTEKLIGFIKKMDTVKGIDVKQYCDFLSKIIE